MLLQILSTSGSPIEARKTAPILGFIIVLGIIIALITLVFFIVKTISSYSQSSEFVEKDKKRKTRKSDVKKLVKKFNLSRQEVDLLWQVCKIAQSPNIKYVVKNNTSIKELFFKAYNLFKKRGLFTPESMDLFFTLLYKLEMTVVQSKKIPTTRSLAVSTIIFYISEDNEQYPLCIIKNEKDFFSVEFPTFLYNSSRKPNILDRCRFLYKTDDGLSYSFGARVIRYEESNDDQVIMIIGHTDQLISQPQRHSKREFVNEACSFSPIRINKNNIKNNDMFIYSDKNYDGKMTNISVGGCCIQTNLPIKEHQHISVSLPSYNISEKIIGIIKKTRRLPNGDFALHIQFTHISLNSKNKIHAIVYKFEL